MILDAFKDPPCLRTPNPMIASSPSLPPWGGRQEMWAARLMKESDPHLPPGLPAEMEHLRANTQGQSISRDTGCPSLPVPDAQWGVLGPVCKRVGPARDSKAPQSKVPSECG